jgi:hypothetical protein
MSLGRGLVRAGLHRPGPAVHERSRVGRVLQDRADRRDGRTASDDVAERFASGDQQILIVQGPDDSGEGPDAEEGGEDQLDAVLDLAIGALDDLPQGFRK